MPENKRRFFITTSITNDGDNSIETEINNLIQPRNIFVVGRSDSVKVLQISDTEETYLYFKLKYPHHIV